MACSSDKAADPVGLDMLEDAVSYHLRIVNLTLSRFLEVAFANTPLEGGTGKVTTLVMARMKPGITAAEIAPFAGKDAPAMTRLVSGLVSHGVLERRPDPDSRRRQLLYLTAEGERLIERIGDAVARERQAVFGMLTEAETAQLLSLLKKVSAASIAGARGETAATHEDA